MTEPPRQVPKPCANCGGPIVQRSFGVFAEDDLVWAHLATGLCACNGDKRAPWAEP